MSGPEDRDDGGCRHKARWSGRAAFVCASRDVRLQSRVELLQETSVCVITAVSCSDSALQ